MLLFCRNMNENYEYENFSIMFLQIENFSVFAHFYVRKEPGLCVQFSSASDCTGWFIGGAHTRTETLYVAREGGIHL